MLILREPFRILTITLLSLLLPLSFLLLARITTAHYLITFNSYPKLHPPSLLFSLFLYANPTLLHALVSIISVTALSHVLTGPITASKTEAPEPILRHRLYTAWIFLLILQVCVGLGLEGSMGAGVDGLGFGRERSFLSRTIFFVGLHETMLYWSKTIVKPVVDDTVFGFSREGTWVDRVGMAISFGTLWWWRLRDEVEALVVVAELKREMMLGVGLGDFVGWWLYYLTVAIGMVRVVKGLLGIGMILLFTRIEDSHGNEEKV